MNGSVDNLAQQQPPPPESWEVADVDASMSRLMLNSRHNHNNNNNNNYYNNNNSSPDLSRNCFSDFGSVSVAPVKSYSVDQFLLDALQNPRERLSVLRMEQDVEKFVRDPSQHQMEFQQLPTSYLRLAAHRVAQHYSLQSTVLLDSSLPDGSGSRIIVHKTSECSLPFIRLADIPVKLPTDESSNSVVKVAIKQRPNKKSQILGANSDLQRSNSLKSVEERKEEYNRARARIFSSSSSGSNGKEETDPRRQEVFHCGSLGASEGEEAYSSTEVDVNSGRGSFDFPTSASRSSESRIEEPISRSRANSKVAIFRDPEVERNDPDYDRSYDRYAQRFDPGFGFNGGSYSVQPMYAPVLTYNTEFPQLGPAHTHRAPSISTEHQSHTLAQHLPGSWMAPSSSAGIGYMPHETMVTSFNPNHASTLYMQYPSQRSGMTFIHPHEQVHHQLAQSQQQQQSDVSFGLARPR